MTSQWPQHGGDLHYAQATFGKPPEAWQDLSTGISPWAYPVPPVPESVWQQLPGDLSPLINAAAHYYGTALSQLLAVPGSQYAIQRFPQAVEPGRVAIPEPGYREHAINWQKAGHHIFPYRHKEQLASLIESNAVDHAVVINPNNPTTEITEPALLEKWHHQLPGYLLVDEAFADTQPHLSSIARLPQCPRLFVLRSLGKFFGLAGLRLGFLIGSGKPADQLRDNLDCWAINHPAIWLGTQALQNTQWQRQQRQRILLLEQQITRLLQQATSASMAMHSAGLFITLTGNRPALYSLYEAFAQQGIFTRWSYNDPTSNNAWLRIGLPADNGERLAHALQNIFQKTSQE